MEIIGEYEKKQALRKEQLPRTLDVRQWNHRVYMFEIELKELKTDKYFMSSKSLKMWIKQTGSNTYKRSTTGSNNRSYSSGSSRGNTRTYTAPSPSRSSGSSSGRSSGTTTLKFP